MITKEQLALENGELKASVQTWSNKDATRRKKFAKVLDRTENIYGNRTPSDLSWEEIFCELGKLMAFRDFQHWKDQIEYRLDALTPQPKVE